MSVRLHCKPYKSDSSSAKSAKSANPVSVYYIETPDFILPVTICHLYLITCNDNTYYSHFIYSYPYDYMNDEWYYNETLCKSIIYGVNIYTGYNSENGGEKFSGCVLHTDIGKLYIYI